MVESGCGEYQRGKYQRGEYMRGVQLVSTG